MTAHHTPHHKPAAPPAPPSEPKDLQPVKSWAYPFATNSGKNPPDPQDYLQALGNAGDGFYPLGASGIWHGGIHFDQQTDGMLKQGDGVRAIADGEVVAYRLDTKYAELDYSDGKKARYSTGFVLVHHKLALPPLPDATKTNSSDPPKPPPPDEVLDLYSLYMHQLDWAGYQEAEQAALPSTDPANPPTPAIQRMPFWQGNACYRVGSKATDKQLPATASTNPTAPSTLGAAAPANAPLITGLHIRDKANGQILGLLPQGSELTVATTSTPGWVTIASINKGAPVGNVQGDDPKAGASNGWVYLADLVSLIDPSPLDAVVVLTKPFRVKAGDLLGYLGQYVRHSDASVLPAASTSRPLLHMEVFAGDAFPAFLAKSRERATKLPDNQKSLLVISPGAALVDISPPVDQKVSTGLTLEPVSGNSDGGRWTKVQPTKIVTAQPTHLKPHPVTTSTKEGDPFWVEHEQSGQVVAGVVNGWKQFPLQLSNPKLATANFMDVFAPAELTRLDADAKAVDDQGVHWWKIEVGTGKGESGSGWVCGKGHPQTAWQSPWDWPGFEIVDGTTVPMADMFKRSIVVNGQALPDEETSFQASAVAVNGSDLFTKLEKAIDLDGNGTVSAQELATAHSTSWLAEALSHLIVRYESEWGGNTSKWATLTPIMKERAPIWADELQRIEKLQWWDQVKTVKDFPAGATVYHLHPIGLIGNFPSTCIPLPAAQLMALTISSGFEGNHPMDYAAVADNFDGMGMSYGLIQWNAGSGTLSPLLVAMRTADPVAFKGAFPSTSNYDVLDSALTRGDSGNLYNWAVQQQSGNPSWKTPFQNLAQIQTFKDIQVATAVSERHQRVLGMIEFLRSLSPELMTGVELVSYCALFDVAVQQTSLAAAATEIKNRVASEKPASQSDLVRLAVEERANAAKHAYVADCMSRRIGILQQSAYSYTAFGHTSQRPNPNFNIISQDAHTYVCKI